MVLVFFKTFFFIKRLFSGKYNWREKKYPLFYRQNKFLLSKNGFENIMFRYSPYTRNFLSIFWKYRQYHIVNVAPNPKVIFLNTQLVLFILLTSCGHGNIATLVVFQEKMFVIWNLLRSQITVFHFFQYI